MHTEEGEREPDGSCHEDADDGDERLRLEPEIDCEPCALHRGKSGNHERKRDDLCHVFEDGHVVELRDVGRCEEQPRIEGERNDNIEIEDGAEVFVGAILLLDECVRKSAVGERVRDGDEYGEHADDAVIRRGEHAGECDAYDEVDSLADNLLDSGPGHSADDFLL